jgi:hypothetical protein
MAVDERARHELFLRVERELGPEAAETLMEMLPPVGWADVATKDDLRQLEERLSLGLRAEFRQALLDQTHTLFRNLVMLCTSLVFAVAGLAFAAAKLT